MASRKTIVRTITATTIKSVNVMFTAGKLDSKENKDITVNGTVDQDQATKIVRKAYGQSAQVTELTEVNDVYEISVEDFMKNAKKVTAILTKEQEEEIKKEEEAKAKLEAEEQAKK